MKRTSSTLFFGALTLSAVVFVFSTQLDVTGKVKTLRQVSLQLEGGQEQTIDADQTMAGDIVLKDDAVLTVKSVVRLRALPGEDRVRVHLSGRAKLIVTNGSIVPADDPRSLDVWAQDESSITLTQAFVPVAISLRNQAKLSATNSAISSIVGPTKRDPSEGAFGAIDLSDAARVELVSSVVGGITVRFGPDAIVDVADLSPQKYIDFSLRTAAKKFTPPMDLILKRVTLLADVTPGQSDAGWSIVTDPKARVHVHTSWLQRLTVGPLVSDRTAFQDLPLGKKLSMTFRGLVLDDSAVGEEWGFWGTDSSPAFRRSEGLWLQPNGTGTWTVDKGSVSRIDAQAFTGDLYLKNITWTDGGRFEDSHVTMHGDIAAGPGVGPKFSLKRSSVRREFRFHGPAPTTVLDVQVFDGDRIIAGIAGPIKNLLLPITFDDTLQGKTLSMQLSINGKTTRKELRLGTSSPIVIGQ